MTALANSFPTAAAAEAALIAEGFKGNDRGYFSKLSRTGGNLIEGPRECVALCRVIHNSVDPEWNAPDYYTIKFV